MDFNGFLCTDPNDEAMRRVERGGEGRAGEGRGGEGRGGSPLLRSPGISGVGAIGGCFAGFLVGLVIGCLATGFLWAPRV